MIIPTFMVLYFIFKLIMVTMLIARVYLNFIFKEFHPEVINTKKALHLLANL